MCVSEDAKKYTHICVSFKLSHIMQSFKSWKFIILPEIVLSKIIIESVYLHQDLTSQILLMSALIQNHLKIWEPIRIITKIRSCFSAIVNI